MPREASGTYTPLPSRSSISSRDEAGSLARRPASRRPGSRRGFMRPPLERYPVYRDAKIDRTFVPLARDQRGRAARKERERRGTRSCRMVGILPSQMATTTTAHPLCRSAWRLPLCFAPAIRVDGLVNLTEIAIHLLSVCLSGSLYPRMPGLDIFRRDFILRF